VPPARRVGTSLPGDKILAKASSFSIYLTIGGQARARPQPFLAFHQEAVARGSGGASILPNRGTTDGSE